MNITQMVKISLLLSSFFICSTSMGQGVITVYGPENGPPDCGKWLTHQKDLSYRNVYSSWLMGFLSGVAMGTKKDFLGKTSPESTFFWMDKYCLENPLETTVWGSMQLIDELKKQKGIN